MISKTVNDIRLEVTAELLSRLPALDLTEGTPERDLFVEAPIAGQLVPLWDKVVYTSKLFAPMIYYTDLVQSDVETYMANFNVVLAGATKSSGSVTFFTQTAPTTDITIPDGTLVSTNESTPVSFAVEGTYTIYSSIASSYYNSVLSRWEITCYVSSVYAGPDYKAGSGAITIISSAVPHIDGVINNNPVSGGASGESLDSGLRRVLAKFQGRGLSTNQGILNYVLGFSSDATVVSAEDVEMLRDLGRGKCIDIYIKDVIYSDANDSVTITSTGLKYPENVMYTGYTITLTKQPVHEVISFSINGTIIPLDDFDIVKDTGLYSLSTSGYDKVSLTSTGMIALTSTGVLTNYRFKPGDLIEINYLYNSLVHTIQDNLYSVENHYVNRDYLVREMIPVNISVFMSFKEVTGQDWNTVASAVELTISSFINGLSSNSNVELADVIGVAKDITSVDNINIGTVSLTNIGGGTKTAQGDIIITKNSYSITGTATGVITLTRWVNG